MTMKSMNGLKMIIIKKMFVVNLLQVKKKFSQNLGNI